MTLDVAEEFGITKFVVDKRLGQLGNTYEWIAADGSLYNTSGDELSNYSDFVNSSYQKDEKTPSNITGYKVTGVEKINDKKELETKNIKGVSYTLPKNQESDTKKIAFPSKAITKAGDVTLNDYTGGNENAKTPYLVVSTKDIISSSKATSGIENSYRIMTKDGEKTKKYRGKVTEEYKDDSGKIATINGYSGSADLDVTDLLIGKTYTYQAGATGKVKPTEAGDTNAGEITVSGILVDGRSLINQDKVIANQLVFTNGGTTQTFNSKARTATGGIEPQEIKFDGISEDIAGKLAVGISNEGGLIVKKLEEGKFTDKPIKIEYFYNPDLSNETTNKRIKLGEFTLKLKNNRENLGELLVKVDPRVKQLIKNNQKLWVVSGSRLTTGKPTDVNKDYPKHTWQVVSFEGLDINEAYKEVTHVNGVAADNSSTDNWAVFKEGGSEFFVAPQDKNKNFSIKENLMWTSSFNIKDINVKKLSYPILVSMDSKKMKVQGNLEFLNENIPVEGYKGEGTINLGGIDIEQRYEFEPQGIEGVAEDTNKKLFIKTNKSLDNVMLDASGKIGQSKLGSSNVGTNKKGENIANKINILISKDGINWDESRNSKAEVTELTRMVIQDNSSEKDPLLRETGKILLGINSRGGLLIEKLTDAKFDQYVKIEYFYQFEETANKNLEVKLGEVVLHIVNEVVSMGEYKFNIDGRYVMPEDRSPQWINTSKVIGTFKELDSGQGTASKAKYTQLFDIVNANKILPTGVNIERAIKVKDRVQIKYDSQNYSMFTKEESSWKDEVAISKRGKLVEFPQKILVSKNNSEYTPDSQDNIFYILGNDKKTYVGNIKEIYLGEIGYQVSNGSIDLRQDNDETRIDKEATYVFLVGATGTITGTTEGATGKSTIEMVIEDNKKSPDGRGRLDSNKNNKIVDVIGVKELTNKGAKEKFGKDTVTLGENGNQITFGISTDGGLTIKGLNPKLTTEKKYEINFYLKSELETGDTIQESTKKAKLVSFTLTLLPGVKELGTITFDLDKRLVQVKNTHPWLTPVGGVYNVKGNGAEKLANYKDFLSTSYTTTVKEQNNDKVIDVRSINNDENLTFKEVGQIDYKHLPIQGRNTTIEMAAFPHDKSDKKAVDLRTYTELNNNDIFVTYLGNIDKTSVTENEEFLLLANDGADKLNNAYTGKLVNNYKSSVEERKTFTDGKIGYDGVGELNITDLMIGSRYVYKPGSTGEKVEPQIFMEGRQITENTSGKLVIIGDGVSIDGRALFGENKNKNIATEIEITSKSTGKVQTISRKTKAGESKEIPPKTVNIGSSIDGTIAIGISDAGGMIVEKLDEAQFNGEDTIVITYNYVPETKGKDVKTKIQLGRFELRVRNDIEDFGDITTTVDPRIYQLVKNSSEAWILTNGEIADSIGKLYKDSEALRDMFVVSQDNEKDGKTIAYNSGSKADGIIYVGKSISDREIENTSNSQTKMVLFGGKDTGKWAVNSITNKTRNFMFHTAHKVTKGSLEDVTVPVIVKGWLENNPKPEKNNSTSKYKIDSILKFAKDVPVEGYVGKGELRLERAPVSMRYDFEPQGSVGVPESADKPKLNITLPSNPGDQWMPLNNTLLDARGKIPGIDYNLANSINIHESEDGKNWKAVKGVVSETFVDLIQDNPGHQAGQGRITLGINSKGGMIIEKETNGHFDKWIKVDYGYSDNKDGGIRVKLGEVVLHIINEVIDLKDVTYSIDGRYMKGVRENKLNQILYPLEEGRTSDGLKNENKMDYGKDRFFSYDNTRFNNQNPNVTVDEIIEVVDRPKASWPSDSKIMGTTYRLYLKENEGYNDESIIPIKKNSKEKIKLGEIKDKFITSLYANSIYDNIFYLFGSDGKIYVGNIKEEIVGKEEYYKGSGKVDITEIEEGIGHIFSPNTTVVFESEETEIESNHGLVIKNKDKFIDTLGVIGTKKGKNIANVIKISNIKTFDGETLEPIILSYNNEEDSIKLASIFNIKVGMDFKTGDFLLQKERGPRKNTIDFTIEYFYVPTKTSNLSSKHVVKLGEYNLNVEDRYFEIVGNNTLDFGNMVYGATQNNKHSVVEFFRVSNPFKREVEFSLKEGNDYNLIQKNPINGVEPAKIPYTVDMIKDKGIDAGGQITHIEVRATADLSSDPPAGNYEGFFDIVVTIKDEKKE